MKAENRPRAKPHLKNVYRIDPDAKSRKGYMRLDMNEGVPGLPRGFVKAAMSKIDAEYLATYPEYATLRKKIGRHNSLNPNNIYLANGSDGAIKNIFDAYISKGDKVLLTDPTFAMYPVYCSIFDARPLYVEYEDDMSFPTEAFIKNISKSIKLAVVVNPNNPTGSAISRKDLIKIIEKCASVNALIIVDEAYFYFYQSSVIDLVKKYKNLIVLRTFSKLCGMAAARVGYVAASPEIVDNLQKVKPTYDVNGLAAFLAEELLDRPGLIKGLIRSAGRGREYLLGKLNKDGIEHKAGCANFILIKCDGRVAEIMKRLADEKHILVGGGFKNKFLKDCIRVTIGSIDIMKIFWNGFNNIWKKRKQLK